MRSQLQSSEKNEGSSTMRRFARNTNAYPSRAKNTENPKSGFEDRRIQNHQSRNMSSNSSDGSDIMIDSNFKSGTQPYYDPFSKPAIELKEMKKPAAPQSRASEKFETDFSLGSVGVRNSYKPTIVKAAVSGRETDEGDDSDEYDRFKSTGVGFSPDKLKGTKAKVEKIKNTDSPSIDKQEQKSQYPYYGANKSNYGRDGNLEQEWSSLPRNEGLASEFNAQFAFLYPQKQQLTKESWGATSRSPAQTGSVSATANTTQKEKRKKKKEQPPEPNFMLNGVYQPYLETRTFYRNNESPKKTPQPTSSQNAGSPQALREWFEALSVQDRVNSLTSTYPILVHSIIDAYTKIKPSSILSLYSIKKDKLTEAPDQAPIIRRRQGQLLDSGECILERVHSDADRYGGYGIITAEGSQVRQFQTLIIKSTRIASNKGEMDTITIHSDLVKNTESFFSLMANATDDKAFSEPVQFVTRNGGAGKPVIETPKWINKNATHYLGIWIIALWEEALWAHFNFAKQVNIAPGVRKNDIQQLFELRSESLQNQEDLAKRWQELGEEGQKKLFDNLMEYAKQKYPDQSQFERENDRRYSPHIAHYQDVGEINYIYAQNPTSRSYGLYTFQDMRISNDSLYRQEYENYGQTKSSINSYQLLDQQGVHSSQTKLMMLFVNTTDTDLKEILDVSGYVPALELIKYLSEIPLQEINQKGYTRRHTLCRQLHMFIQEDLRQSIQEQLMNDLLAIDSNNSTKNPQAGVDGEDKKKRKKTDVRKNKKKSGQAQQQPNPTYQKKKSMSKSPQRENAEVLVQAESNRDPDIVKKQQQQRQVQAPANYKPFQKEAHHGVASTTTSDDQAVQIDILGKQNSQKEKSTPPKTSNIKRDKQKIVSSEQQTKKKITGTISSQGKIQSVLVFDQSVVLSQVRVLLADLIESVCQQEEERKASESLALEQQHQAEEVHEEPASSSLKEVSEDERNEAPKIANDSENDGKIHTDEAKDQEKKSEEQPPVAQPKKRKRNPKKKQDASEIMNNFMRKLHGGDPDNDTPPKNTQNNRNRQNIAKTEPDKGLNRRQSASTQSAQATKPTQSNQRTESGRERQQKQPRERRANDAPQGSRQKSDTQTNQDRVDSKKQADDQTQKLRPAKTQVDSELERSPKQITTTVSEIPMVQSERQSRVQQPVTGLKKKMFETNTVQFFQIQNQIGLGATDAQGGIFVEPNFDSQTPFNFVAVQDQISTITNDVGSAQGNATQLNSSAPLPLPQREMISLTDYFMQPQNNLIFGNFRDFGAKDDNVEAASNLYENSKVRRIDYNQQKGTVDLSNLLEKEIELPTPSPWQAIIPKSSERWENLNQVAMSTTSVSFTPTAQMSPQVSIRSDNHSIAEVSSTNLFMPPPNETEFIAGQNRSPPLIKYNSQMSPVTRVDPIFYQYNAPYQQNYIQPQFEQPYFKQQYPGPHAYQSQDNFSANKQTYQKGKAPFRPPQQIQQSTQKYHMTQRSPTNLSQTHENLNSPQFDGQQPGRWQNDRVQKVSPEFPIYNSQVDYQKNFLPQFDLQQNALIRVNAPDFYPLNEQRQNQVADNWSRSGNSMFDQSHQTMNQGQGLPNQGQSNQTGNEKDFLFQHSEDAFYAQFDQNIAETAEKIQKSIEKFDDERNYVLGMLQAMANKAFPGSKPVLKLFGSIMTGLALETSDMDIAVTGLRIEDRMAMIDDLHALEDEIKKWPIVKDLKAIDTASIPVIKANLSMKAVAREMLKAFADDMADIDLPIDITFDDTPIQQADQYRQNGQDQSFYQPQNQMISNYSPNYGTDFRNSNMIQSQQNPMDPLPQLLNLIVGELGQSLGNNDQMTGFAMEFGGSPQAKMHQGMISCNVIKEYVQIYPCLKEVVLLLKRFLAVNNLNSAYQGGISSYSTVLLVVAYMNNFNLHKSPHLTPSRLLMGFLEFYCNHFDPKVYGVNTANGGSYYVLPHTNQQQMFVIQDPVQASNNTARNSFRTQDVLNHFRAAFQSLRNLIIKEYHKNLDTEKHQKTETESVTQVVESVQAVQSVQVASYSKAEKSSDVAGVRQKQAQHKRAGATPLQDTAATKATEQQHNLQSLSSSQHVNAFSAAPQSQNTASFGRARFSIAQSFSSVNFVEKFLSREILQAGAEQQSIIQEPRQGQF